MRLALTLAALAAPCAVQAAEPALKNNFSYDYAEARIELWDISDGFGIGVAGAHALQNDVHLFGSFTVGSLDGPANTDVDVRELVIGGAYHKPVSNQADLILGGGVKTLWWDAGPADDDESGLLLKAALRFMTPQGIEVGGAVMYEDVGDSDLVLNLNAWRKLDARIHLGVELESGDDYDIIRGVGRMYF